MLRCRQVDAITRGQKVSIITTMSGSRVVLYVQVIMHRLATFMDAGAGRYSNVDSEWVLGHHLRSHNVSVRYCVLFQRFLPTIGWSHKAILRSAVNATDVSRHRQVLLDILSML